MALGRLNLVITHMILNLKFAQGSGGHYVHSVLTVTHDPQCVQWVCNNVWSTDGRQRDWWTVESEVESAMNQRSGFLIDVDHDSVTVDTITKQDHVLFLAHSHWTTAWDFVANGNWKNWRVKNRPNPDLWNTQWKESQQCTAIDWVHDPELNWADYSRLCSKFDLKPNSAVKKLHRKYHQCRRTAVEQYKQWRESDGKTVDAQINLWYKQYGL